MRLPRPARHHLGFTLIELMVILVVIGILAAIAIPNYNEYVRRSRATEGMTGLSNARVQMEQFFQDNRSYDCSAFPAGCQAGNACPLNVQAQSTQNFSFACSGLATTTYTLTATGIGSMVGVNYTIDQTNTRTSTFDGTSSATCWLKSKGGAC